MLTAVAAALQHTRHHSVRTVSSGTGTLVLSVWNVVVHMQGVAKQAHAGKTGHVGPLACSRQQL